MPIRLLPPHVAELIAAGEVVERPASVVKELLENAIDAGATAVSVEVERGGVQRITVTDNGCGIPRADVPAAFLRHATSKIATADDLDAIHTLGFRGEALASVAAVARVELLTRAADELAGTRYAIEGGAEKGCEDAGRAQGTTIVIHDLFYNTPARLKFLHKDSSEGLAAAAAAEQTALAHPGVSVRFTRDGKQELFTPGGGDALSAIYAALGKSFADALLPVRYNDHNDGIRVEGFVGVPAAARASRSMQYIFLNTRPIRSKTVTAALEQGCRGATPPGKFPVCVLYITMPPDTVDVNVSPSKTEVRFAAEQRVFHAVYAAVKGALPQASSAPLGLDFPASSQTVAPSSISASEQPEQTTFTVAPFVDPSAYSPVGQAPLSSSASVLRDASLDIAWESPTLKDIAVLPARRPPDGTINPLSNNSPSTPNSAPLVPAQPPIPALVVLGELMGTYIVAARGDEAYIIDKHAAHERLLYDTLTRETHAQQLLSPVAVALPREEHAAVLDAAEELAALGFELEDFGGSVLIRAVPMELDDVERALRDIAGVLLAGGKADVRERLLQSVACRAAVKARDRQHPEELEALVRRVLDENVRACPHGRPVLFILTKQELEKRFSRSL